MKKVFALVDCNNFYVSCERLFRPALKGRPVVVLSNNDGCIISRSNEAKGLGIAMGAPYYKNLALLGQQKVEVFSSNYPLYGDMSQRVMVTLAALEPEVEIYSIDEAFIRLPAGTRQELEGWGRRLIDTVRQHTGLPVSVGIGATKTLAKIANQRAKKDNRYQGCLDISSLPEQEMERLLQSVEVGEVWGIGRRHAARLQGMGITSALVFRNLDDGWLRKKMTVTGLRTAMELRGTPCVELDTAPAVKQSIATSRSFGHPVASLADLREAVATYMAVAAAKLRRQKSVAGSFSLYLNTNSFNEQAPQYRGSRLVGLPVPTAHTPTLTAQALAVLEKIFRPGFAYQKTGVVLCDLRPAGRGQQHLFAVSDGEKQQRLMQAMDRLNRRWGSRTLQCASAGFDKDWRNRQDLLSPAYTTNWEQLPEVKAG